MFFSQNKYKESTQFNGAQTSLINSSSNEAKTTVEFDAGVRFEPVNNNTIGENQLNYDFRESLMSKQSIPDSLLKI